VKAVVENFMTDLRDDPRYKDSLVVLMVENNLVLPAVEIMDWCCQDKYQPIWAVNRKKNDEVILGVRTDNITKRGYIVKGWVIFEGDLFRVAQNLIGRNSVETLTILQQELKDYIVQKIVTGETIKYVQGGKHAGPDDFATALLMGFYNADLAKKTQFVEDLVKVQKQYRATYEIHRPLAH